MQKDSLVGLKCANCGKIFYHYPVKSEVYRKRFCSCHCLSEYPRKRAAMLVRGKMVDLYLINGDFIKTFINVRYASNETGIDTQSIYDNLRGKTQAVGGGYVFRWHQKKKGEAQDG